MEKWGKRCRNSTAIYINRNRIERCFGRMKHFRRFASRYERGTTHFQGFVHLAVAMTGMS